MKKIITLTCMIICIFGLTACGSVSLTTGGAAMAIASIDLETAMLGVIVALIIIIISLFCYILKIQARYNEGKKEERKDVGINNTISQIVEKEEMNVTSDLELVAVITAAIAAYEGTVSTNGFVVRSIRKVNRRK